jgi:hypothetical protein
MPPNCWANTAVSVSGVMAALKEWVHFFGPLCTLAEIEHEKELILFDLELRVQGIANILQWNPQGAAERVQYIIYSLETVI